MKYALLLAVTLLAACSKEPVAQSQTDNPKITVATLFKHDGCTVYRFIDAGAHYFVKCEKTQAVLEQHTESCGKNCTRSYYETVPTHQ